MARQLFRVASAGQYGHLKGRTLPLAIFCRDTLQRTCPQGSSMGELSGVLCSRDTGQANIEWKTNCLPSSNSCTVARSPLSRHHRVGHCRNHVSRPQCYDHAFARGRSNSTGSDTMFYGSPLLCCSAFVICVMPHAHIQDKVRGLRTRLGGEAGLLGAAERSPQGADCR